MAALGNFGSSWQVLGEPGEVSRELWEAPYINKTPDQPHSGRYAIANDDEEGIEECRSSVHGNQHLRREVFDTLNAEEEEYMVEYNARKAEAAKAKSKAKHETNVKAAENFAKKQKDTEAK